MSNSPAILNQRISNLYGLIAQVSVPSPTSSNLSDVLANGNDATNQSILNVNDIDVVTINGSAYPPVVAADTLSAVLTAGNTATNKIILNNGATNVITTDPTLNTIVVTDGTTTNTIDKNGYTTRNSVQNITHYLNFSDSSATGTSAIQKTAGLNCNPSTNAITATTFVGALTGNASTATNIAGGAGGQVLYQSAVNTTAKLTNGTAGQVLTSAGTTLAPVWSSVPIAIINIIYPIGAIIQSSVSTNPGSYITGTTWVTYGAGQVLVGKATSGTFVTAGSTGGDETTLIDSNNLPTHTHPATTTSTDAGHSHSIQRSNQSASIVGTDTSTFYKPLLNSGTAAYTTQLGYASITSSTIVNDNVTTNTAINNLQPYIVVYTWTRTA
jgi:microcystin-dependent protein